MQVAVNLKAFTAQISDYPSGTLRDRDFEQLCADNPEAKLETNAQGQLIVMSPTGGRSG